MDFGSVKEIVCRGSSSEQARLRELVAGSRLRHAMLGGSGGHRITHKQGRRRCLRAVSGVVGRPPGSSREVAMGGRGARALPPSKGLTQ